MCTAQLFTLLHVAQSDKMNLYFLWNISTEQQIFKCVNNFWFEVADGYYLYFDILFSQYQIVVLIQYWLY